jgi:hypothetical protein
MCDYNVYPSSLPSFPSTVEQLEGRRRSSAVTVTLASILYSGEVSPADRYDRRASTFTGCLYTSQQRQPAFAGQESKYSFEESPSFPVSLPSIPTAKEQKRDVAVELKRTTYSPSKDRSKWSNPSKSDIGVASNKREVAVCEETPMYSLDRGSRPFGQETKMSKLIRNVRAFFRFSKHEVGCSVKEAGRSSKKKYDDGWKARDRLLF